MGKDHVTLGIGDSITVDDEVGRLESLVTLLEALNSLTDKSAHLGIDDLSALRNK